LHIPLHLPIPGLGKSVYVFLDEITNGALFFFSPIYIHPSNSYPIAAIIFFWSNMKLYYEAL